MSKRSAMDGQPSEIKRQEGESAQADNLFKSAYEIEGVATGHKQIASDGHVTEGKLSTAIPTTSSARSSAVPSAPIASA
ncbi:MAG TPA: hypothetical protein V6D08_06575 [Candidatus Obscuribacterales bacterium]